MVKPVIALHASAGNLPHRETMAKNDGQDGAKSTQKNVT